MNKLHNLDINSSSNAESIKISLENNLKYRLAKTRNSATKYDKFMSLAYSVVDRLVDRWIATQDTYKSVKPKRVYYLSMEWLLGRSLENCLVNLDIYDECKDALKDLGIDINNLLETELDAGLGNGGLGRLAACFMDSMSTLGIPAIGYGLRYEFGLFHQRIVDGKQVETPDNWLSLPNPWEIMHPEYIINVQFGGNVKQINNKSGKTSVIWEGGEEEKAIPYDMPIPGYKTNTVNTLRLWSAKSIDEFNLEYFNHGDYIRACEEQMEAENLTRVLYPNDKVFAGQELRLKQEFFLVSASIQDIIMRFFRECGIWRLFPEKVAIHLNDTHPALAIPELMRIFIDQQEMTWDEAWDLTVRTFAYTNHTVLPEALEEWPVFLLEQNLPRHMEIIYQINLNFLKEVSIRYPGDISRLTRMSLIAEDGQKRVRMANLAVVGSHSVNGVSKLHTQLLCDTIMRDFNEFYPGKFNNKTNGITPRRWLLQANQPLSHLITEAIGDGWIKNLTELRQLEPLADDQAFRIAWREAQAKCKEPLNLLVQRECGIKPLTGSIYDVQVKRFHEYKRQLLFAMYIITTYLRIKADPNGIHIPRTFMIGGKAAPGYERAKLIIHLIANMANIINKDPEINGNMRVLFLPNYRVSLAEKLIPAADLSEQISMAGMEASGTSNMKFMLNGSITIGTLDGANIEMLEEVGKENIFIFGHTADEIIEIKRAGYFPDEIIENSPILQQILHLLECDFFCPGEQGTFRPIYDDLISQDRYCHIADFAAYLACQDAVTEAYKDIERWTRMSIMNTARSGKFSSDRTIMEYVKDIWNVGVVPVEK